MLVDDFQFTPTALTLDSGVTRPPPLLSEADLLSCMDKVRNLCFLVEHTCSHLLKLVENCNQVLMLLMMRYCFIHFS